MFKGTKLFNVDADAQCHENFRNLHPVIGSETMLLIYIPTITNRADYIFNLIFGELLGAEFTLTDSPEDFLSFTGPKINYSTDHVDEGIFFKSTGILFENIVITQNIETMEFEGSNVLFFHDDKKSALPFDPFAAAFYLVTRYEEYLPFKPDKYGRFRIHDSIAYYAKFLHQPVINIWALRIRDIILQHYPAQKFNLPQYRHIPTIDIDHAYAFKYRKIWRTFGSYWRSVVKQNWPDIVLRTEVLLGRKRDPYDNYSYLDKLHASESLKVLYFMLFADYGRDDNNVTITNSRFHDLVRTLDKTGTIGIHPSLSSNKHFSKLNTEIIRLSKVLHRSIHLSRQHFLKINLPKTYRNLIELGITDDYSMGYAASVGFRASIASPFNFFDLLTNFETPLRIHPVSIMDVTLHDYYHLDRERAIEKIRKTIGIVKSVNGEFVSLWHNESLSDTGRWQGWRAVYEEMLVAAR